MIVFSIMFAAKLQIPQTQSGGLCKRHLHNFKGVEH